MTVSALPRIVCTASTTIIIAATIIVTTIIAPTRQIPITTGTRSAVIIRLTIPVIGSRHGIIAGPARATVCRPTTKLGDIQSASTIANTAVTVASFTGTTAGIITTGIGEALPSSCQVQVMK